MDTNQIDRQGVSKCSYLFAQNNFIFREQTISDYGIDALIETKEESSPTGKLIAVQIKSGDSFFKETDGENIVFRVDEKHRNYWINHSLPVIIVLYSPSLDECIWEVVNQQTLELCTKQWKIRIPKKQTISNSCYKLRELSRNMSEYEHRRASLVFAKEWMIQAHQYGSLILEVQEWVNKSSGRGRFILKTQTDNGNEKVLFDRELFGFGLKQYEMVIQEMFPWAHIEIDREFYETNWGFDNNQNWDYYDEKCANTPHMRCEIPNDGIFPYRNGAGEVDFYRLLLSLNPLGEAFLKTECFLENGKLYLIDHLKK